VKGYLLNLWLGFRRLLFRMRRSAADLLAPKGCAVYRIMDVESQQRVAGYMGARMAKLPTFNSKWSRRRKIGQEIIGVSRMLAPGAAAAARPARTNRRPNDV
jgi:hypothetical protein